MVDDEHEVHSTAPTHILSKKWIFLVYFSDKILVFQGRKLCCNLGPLCLFCYSYNSTLVCIYPPFLCLYIFSSSSKCFPLAQFYYLEDSQMQCYLIPTIYIISLSFTLFWDSRHLALNENWSNGMWKS